MPTIDRHYITTRGATGILFVFLAVACIAPSMAFSRELPPDADAVFAFAEHAYAQGDYGIAVQEFKRFVFFFPDDPRAEQAMFKTGMSHFNQGRFGRAVEAFDAVVRKYGHTGYAIESAFMGAESDKRLGDHDAALYRLNALTSDRFDPVVQDRALYGIGWLFLERRNHASAGRAFAAIDDTRKTVFQADDILARLDELETLPGKSPTAAGLFSAVPGGGYLYTGRRSDALISFVFTGAAAGAAYESFDNDLNVLGSILAVVAAGFYSGSIYGSIGAAHKYNDRVYDGFVADLKRRTPDPAVDRPGFVPGPQKGAVGFTLNVSF